MHRHFSTMNSEPKPRSPRPQTTKPPAPHRIPQTANGICKHQQSTAICDGSATCSVFTSGTQKYRTSRLLEIVGPYRRNLRNKYPQIPGTFWAVGRPALLREGVQPNCGFPQGGLLRTPATAQRSCGRRLGGGEQDAAGRGCRATSLFGPHPSPPRAPKVPPWPFSIIS